MNSDPQASADSRRTILVAEDDAGVRTFIVEVLTRWGYDLLVANDGQQALEMARELPGEIDLLLTDLEMPRLHGLALIEQMRHERPQVAVLLMSGNPIAHELAASVHVPFLRKPFRAAALHAAIGALLSPNRASGAKVERAGG